MRKSKAYRLIDVVDEDPVRFRAIYSGKKVLQIVNITSKSKKGERRLRKDSTRYERRVCLVMAIWKSRINLSSLGNAAKHATIISGDM
jgi:hypothetical protein